MKGALEGFLDRTGAPLPRQAKTVGWMVGFPCFWGYSQPKGKKLGGFMINSQACHIIYPFFWITFREVEPCCLMLV